MPRRKLTPAAIALALLISMSAFISRARAERPNIVVILADDLGYGDVGCYNPRSKISTPCLDRLATQGVRFTDAHAPASVCSPTRYAMLTGRYAWRSPLKRGVLGPWDPPIISASRLTIATLLKQDGYATAAIGKWHLGWTWPTKDGAPASSGENRLSNVDFTKPIADGPTAHGFDYYFGVDVPNYPPYTFIENDRVVVIPSEPDGGRGAHINRPGPMAPGWQLVDVLPKLTDRAVRWIEESAKAKRPFFLYLALTSPHYPIVPAPQFKGKSQAGDYGDFVCQTDWTVGQVLDALDKSGVADNTLVIFTSDNGPEITGEVNPGAYDRAKQYGHYSMGDLRGAKRDTWEGGHRVPFLVRWPGHVKPNTESGDTICHVDLLATLAEIVGAKLPADAGEDSFSFLPLLAGAASTGRGRPPLVHHSASGKFAIRQGEWVLIVGATGDDNGKHGEPAWLKAERSYVDDREDGQLFNLREDLSERKNYYAQEPQRVSEMTSLLGQYRREGRSTPGPPQENDPPRAARAAKTQKQLGANLPFDALERLAPATISAMDYEDLLTE